MIYFTSDTHFSHANIIKYCDRPFTHSNEMDEVMIKNWNDQVGIDDTIYHLGDFAFGRNPEKYFSRLNGNKYLITGNHDKRNVLELQWNGVHDYLEITVDHQKLVLFHYKCEVFNGSHHGRIQLYGHSHNTLSENSQQLDVGVDCWEFKPITIQQIQERLRTLPPYKQKDDHKQV